MAETHFLGEEGQDSAASRLTPEANARIDAMVNDPDFQPKSEDLIQVPDPFGMNWSWAEVHPDDDFRAREQAHERTQQLVEDPSFRRLLGHLFDVTDQPIQQLVDDTDFRQSLSNLLHAADKVIHRSG